MEKDLQSDVNSGQSFDEGQTCLGVDYVPAAPLVDVLFEQLEFLSAHLTNGEDCPPTCPLCARLDAVSRCLLAPFSNPLNEN